MENEHEPADNNPAESTEQRKERLDQVSSFAGFLTSHMVEAISADNNVLGWEDIVVAAGLAVRAIGHVAAIIMTQQTGKEAGAEDIEGIEQRIDALLAKARSVNVTCMRVDSMEEADAYMAGVEKGFH